MASDYNTSEYNYTIHTDFASPTVFLPHREEVLAAPSADVEESIREG